MLFNSVQFAVFFIIVYGCLRFHSALSPEALIKGMALFNSITGDIAEKEKIIYADISKGLGRNKGFYSDYLHLNAVGARVVAQNYRNALAAYIRKNGIRKN